jgi:hypothetical protein
MKDHIDNWAATVPVRKLSEQQLAAYLVSLAYMFELSERNLITKAGDAALTDDMPGALILAQKAYEEYGHAKWAGVPSHPDLIWPLAVFSSALSPRDYLVYAFWAEYMTTVLGPRFLAAQGHDVPAVSLHVEADAHHAQVELDYGLDVVERCCQLFDAFVERLYAI